MRTSQAFNSAGSSGNAQLTTMPQQHLPPTATAHTTYNYAQRLTSSAVSDSGTMIFSLYPSHGSIHCIPGAQNNAAEALGPDRHAADLQQQQMFGGGRADKKVFFEQPDGGFADAAREAHLRQVRVATHAQLEALRASVPTWSDEDDAKTFAPFFLHVVFALTHVRRMLTGAAAGFSIVILLAIYWAPALEGLSVDNRTGTVIVNSTIGGAFGELCLASNRDQCSATVAYAAIYKATSYMLLVVSLLCTFLSLVPFTFDIVLMRMRERQLLTGGTTSLAAMAAFQQQQQQQQQYQQNQLQQSKQNQYATAPALANAAATGGVPGGVGAAGDGVAQTTTSRMAAGPPVATTGAYMTMMHLVVSTFPFFFVSLVCCWAMARVEVDRRTQASMVRITTEQFASLRASLVVRSVALILAWLFSFRFTESAPSDMVLNAAAVIDVRA